MFEVGAFFGDGSYFFLSKYFLGRELLELGDALLEIEAGFVAGAGHDCCSRD